MSGAARRDVIEWGWAGSALEGESGDVHVVVPFPHGALVALLDGLGHGSEAAAAAMAAIPVLEAHPSDPILTLIHRCHAALRKTRGAAMTLASFTTDDASMTWSGIGNVDGILVRSADGSPRTSRRAAEAIGLRGGVVGYQLPTLRAHTVAVSPGDTLILTTDGIRSGYDASIARADDSKEIAESILSRFSKGTDDAHVLVARYLGGEP